MHFSCFGIFHHKPPVTKVPQELSTPLKPCIKKPQQESAGDKGKNADKAQKHVTFHPDVEKWEKERRLPDCSDILSDERYFQSAQGRQISGARLDAEQISNALGVDPCDKKPQTEAERVILAQALSHACAGQRDGKTIAATRQEASRVLKSLQGTDIVKDLAGEGSSIRAEDRERVWHAILALSSSATGRAVLQKLTADSQPRSEEEQKALDLFLKAAVRLASENPSLPADPAKLLAGSRLLTGLDEFRHVHEKDSRTATDKLGDLIRLEVTLKGAHDQLVQLRQGKEQHRAEMDPDAKWHMLMAENDLSTLEEKQTERALTRLDKWMARSTEDKSFGKRLFNATLRRVFAPQTNKNPLGTLKTLPSNFFCKKGDMTPSQMKTAASQLSEALALRGAMSKDGVPTGKMLGTPTQDATDAQWRPYVRQQILDTLLERGHALLNGTSLNHWETRDIEDRILKNLPLQENDELRDRIRALIRENAGPVTRDVLQKWKSDLTSADYNIKVSSNVHTVDWHDFDKATSEDNGYGVSDQSKKKGDDKEPFLVKKPTSRDVAAAMTDIAERLGPGEEFTMDAGGRAGLTTSPIFGVVSKVATLGVVRLAPDVTVTKGRQAIVSTKNTGTALQMFVGVERATKGSVGCSLRVGLDVGGPVAALGITPGASVSYGQTGTTRDGVLIRMLPSDGKAITDADKKKFAELVGSMLDEKGDVDSGQSRLKHIFEECPEISVNKVSRKKGEETYKAAVSLWAGLDLAANEHTGFGIGVNAEAAIGKTKTKTTSEEVGKNTARSESAKDQTAIGLGVGADVGLLLVPNENSRILTGTGKQLWEKEIPLFNPALNEITYSESGNRITSIRKTKQFENFKEFESTVTKDMIASMKLRPGLTMGKLNEQMPEVHQFLDRAEGLQKSAKSFDLSYHMKPELVDRINAYRDIARNATMEGNMEAAGKYRARADKLLADPASWAVSGADVIENKEKHERFHSVDIPLFFAVTNRNHSARLDENKEHFPLPGGSEPEENFSKDVDESPHGVHANGRRSSIVLSNVERTDSF